MTGARKRILRESIPTSESSSEVMRMGVERKKTEREMETNI